MNARPLSAVFYAINGTGLGHITRQCNIARDMRSLLERLGIPERFEILTTSDAPQVASDFLVTKLPSKTTVRERGFNTRKFAAQARNLIGNFMSAVSPDLLLVDTDPRGSFAEIAFVRGFAKQLVFVDRQKDERVLNSASYGANVRMYDLVVVPEEPDANRARAPRTEVVGKIQSFVPERALARSAARALYGVGPRERLVYVSAGGGGDPKASEQIGAIVEAVAALPETVVAVGYGPLFDGCVHRKRRNVVPLQGCDIAREFAGFDLAISAAGYNTHEELLAACVPTLFYAQPKGMDRQDLRIEASLAHGWCGVLGSWEPSEIRAQVESFLSEEAIEMRTRLLRRPMPHGNVHAARHVLRLALSKAPYCLSSDEIDRASADLIATRDEARASLFS